MSLKKFEHVILTKFNTQPFDGELVYDRGFPENWMDYRMGLFERTKKSVLSQDADFRWVIALDPRTHDRYVKRICSDRRISVTAEDIRGYFDNHRPQADWVITTRLDNDDFYLPGALKAIQGAFEPMLKVIDISFFKMHNHTEELYISERLNSMFISLVEPSERVVTVFARPHGQLSGGYPISGSWDTSWGVTRRIPYERIEEPQVVMVCHGRNASNQITSTDRYFCELKDL